MHHDVCGPSSRLVRRKRIGAFRVHDGKAATAEVAVDAALDESVVLGNNAAGRHLAACSRNGQHHTNRQTGLRDGFSCPEIPHVAIIQTTIANGFG